MRLDVLLSESGRCRSRSEAQSRIRSGDVRVNGNIVTKCAYEVSEDAHISLDGEVNPYVSRGGLKLEAAIRQFRISPAGLVAVDIGASSGGFTDCLLQNGAKRVYAVENGCGQLVSSIAGDPRVISMEHCNARYLTAQSFPEPIDIVTMDVSFISQTLIHPAICTFLKPGGVLISLIKPQFEVGKSGVGKGGIVKDSKRRDAAIERVCRSADANGFVAVGTAESPITGGDGNREYLAIFIRRKEEVS